MIEKLKYGFTFPKTIWYGNNLEKVGWGNKMPHSYIMDFIRFVYSLYKRFLCYFTRACICSHVISLGCIHCRTHWIPSLNQNKTIYLTKTSYWNIWMPALRIVEDNRLGCLIMIKEHIFVLYFCVCIRKHFTEAYFSINTIVYHQYHPVGFNYQ